MLSTGSVAIKYINGRLKGAADANSGSVAIKSINGRLKGAVDAANSRGSILLLKPLISNLKW